MRKEDVPEGMSFFDAEKNRLICLKFLNQMI